VGLDYKFGRVHRLSEHLHQRSVRDPCVTQQKSFSHPSLALLLATHLDQSNYLANQKQGAVNKYDLIVFITLFRGSSRALRVVGSSSGFPVDSLDLTH
jgi:hypothetical protein